MVSTDKGASLRGSPWSNNEWKVMTMKKLSALLLVLVMIFSTVGVFSSYADNDKGGDLTKLTVPKTTYEFDEPILISALSVEKDSWVGIYFPDDLYSLRYVYIDPAMDKGVGSGVEFDIKTAGFDGSNACNTFPLGEYIIKYYPNDRGASATAWVKIKIVPPADAAQAEKPVSVKYELNNATDGLAAGKLTVKVKDPQVEKNIIPYWGNENGKLEEYMPLAKFQVTGEETVYEFPKWQIIPEGATKLLVYTSNMYDQVSSECFEVDLPEGAAYKDPGKPIAEFQVVSDTHAIDSAVHTYNNNILYMFKDIAKLSPESLGLFVAGDMTENGREGEYIKFKNLHKSVEGAPPYFFAIGNHDMFGGDHNEKTALFLKYAKLPNGKSPTSVHYDFWLNGYHFVFLGNDKLVNQIDATLTKETIAWLDETLAQDRDKNRPTFLFIHQGLENTVAGTLYGENWDGIVASSATLLRITLKKYPEVIMFNGHSHWEFDSIKTMYPRSAALPTIFNTSSVSSQTSFYNKVDQMRVEKSEGYYIKVYEDRVLVLGRNYIDAKWVPSAMYVVDYDNGTGPKKDTVSFDVLGVGGGVDPVKVIPGTKLEAPTPTADGYEFAGWFTDKELKKAFDPETAIDGDITLYAKWNKLPEPIPEDTTTTTDPTTAPEPTLGDESSSGIVVIVICGVLAVAVVGAAVVLIIKKKKK